MPREDLGVFIYKKKPIGFDSASAYSLGNGGITVRVPYEGTIDQYNSIIDTLLPVIEKLDANYLVNFTNKGYVSICGEFKHVSEASDFFENISTVDDVVDLAEKFNPEFVNNPQQYVRQRLFINSGLDDGDHFLSKN